MSSGDRESEKRESGLGAGITWPPGDRAIRDSLMRAIDSGDWGRYDSELGDALIEQLRSQFRVREVLPCCSGTIGVELALRGVGVKAGDEVILAGYDFPGNFRAIEAIGARPVLVDVEKGGVSIELSQVARAVSGRCRALLVSHLHGQIVDMVSAREIVAANGIFLIEDACQVPGASLDGQPLGSFGDAGVLSFGGSKLLTAGRGGAVLSNDSGVIQRARIFGSRGNEAFPLSQLQAAVLLPQLGFLANLTKRRGDSVRKVVNLARERNCFGFDRWISNGPCVQAWYKLPLLLPEDASANRDEAIGALRHEGISCGPGFRGFAKRTARRCRRVNSLPNSVEAAKRLVLFDHTNLLKQESDLERFVDGVVRTFSGGGAGGCDEEEPSGVR